MLSYLIWNGNPEIYSYGSLSLRWYGLLFALGFLISQQILYYMFRKEGKPERDVETLTVYMVVATILGARLGHVIFYQPEMFWQDPLGILLPFEFSPEFRFTGLQGLASHGGAFGILFALWLYSRKKKPGQNYLQTLDRIVIVVALTGALIRLGNFYNSEIIGKPTDNPMGVLFVSSVSEVFTKPKITIVESVHFKKNTDEPDGQNGRKPIHIYLLYKPGTTLQQIDTYLEGDAQYYLARTSEFTDASLNEPLVYRTYEESPGQFISRININGISRHPAQLYESISCVFLFAFLFWLWSRKKAETSPGLIFGWFMVILWTLRFSYEFLKENQVAFENQLPINMGQILSIPMVITGIIILIVVTRKKTSAV